MLVKKLKLEDGGTDEVFYFCFLFVSFHETSIIEISDDGGSLLNFFWELSNQISEKSNTRTSMRTRILSEFSERIWGCCVPVRKFRYGQRTRKAIFVLRLRVRRVNTFSDNSERIQKESTVT